MLLMLVGAAFCAQKDIEDADIRSVGVCKPLKKKRQKVSFALDGDKQGYVHKGNVRQIVLADIQFTQALKRYERINFSGFFAIASDIYNTDIWGRALNVVQEEKRLCIDLEKQEFVWGDPVIKHPKERIEVAITRFFEDDSMRSRRDLVLMLYDSGYRDYSYKSIVGKELSLLAAGFIKRNLTGMGGDTLIKRLHNHWCVALSADDEGQLALFDSVSSHDVPAVYQMIYILRHGILQILRNDALRNSGESFGFALRRQENIMDYLKERECCTLREVVSAMEAGVYVFPRGVLNDVVTLIFLQKMDVALDMDTRQYIFSVKSNAPPVKDDACCDEVVFLRNLCRYPGCDAAVLATYAQGYRTYSPAKLYLYRGAFDIMGFLDAEGRSVPRDLEEFLAKHQVIPQIWSWSDELLLEGRELVMAYERQTLESLFEMHNRGKLAVVMQEVRKIAVERQKPFYDKGKDLVKNRLTNGLCCSAYNLMHSLRRLGRVEGQNWTAVLHVVGSLAPHLDYNEAEGEFQWLPSAKPRQSFSEEQKLRYSCVLRNRYPQITLKGFAFMLASRVGPISENQARIIFSALDVADLVPASNKKPSRYVARCQKFFHKEKSNPGWLTRIPITFKIDGESLDGRGRQIVHMAGAMFKDPQFAELVKTTTVCKGWDTPYVKALDLGRCAYLDEDALKDDCALEEEEQHSSTNTRFCLDLTQLIAAAEHLDDLGEKKTSGDDDAPGVAGRKRSRPQDWEEDSDDDV